MGQKLSSTLYLFPAIANLLASPVSAHGHVKTHLMNGVSYIGFLPISKPDFTADAPSIGAYKVYIFGISMVY